MRGDRKRLNSECKQPGRAYLCISLLIIPNRVTDMQLFVHAGRRKCRNWEHTKRDCITAVSAGAAMTTMHSCAYLLRLAPIDTTTSTWAYSPQKSQQRAQGRLRRLTHAAFLLWPIAGPSINSILIANHLLTLQQHFKLNTFSQKYPNNQICLQKPTKKEMKIKKMSFKKFSKKLIYV